MSDRPYVLLVTPEEHGQILKFNSLGLTGEALAKATGELVGLPWEEFTHPLYAAIDSRAPGLRFDYWPPQPPPTPPAGGDTPAPVAPAPVGDGPSISLTIDNGQFAGTWYDLTKAEALKILTGAPHGG